MVEFVVAVVFMVAAVVVSVVVEVVPPQSRYFASELSAYL